MAVDVKGKKRGPRNDVRAVGIFRFKGPYDVKKILDEELGSRGRRGVEPKSKSP